MADDQTPPITVRVKEIRPCPDGTFNLVLDGAGCDLNFTAEALTGMGIYWFDEPWSSIVKGDPKWDKVTIVPDQPTGDLRSNIEPPSPERIRAIRNDTRTQRVVKAMRDLFAENHLAPADAATMWALAGPTIMDWEINPVAFIDEPGVREAVAEVISKDQTGTSTRHDVRPSPSRTVAFEDLYPWPPIIRRSDTVYHAIQWVPGSEITQEHGHFKDMERFVDEHSICDFTVHHQTTTDRLIVRRHDRSIPITVEALDYLIAEVETGQLFTATPAEYRARFCEAP